MFWIYGIKSCHKPRTINLFLAPCAPKNKMGSKGKEKKWPKKQPRKKSHKRNVLQLYLNL
jgi:hypothetical protein